MAEVARSGQAHWSTRGRRPGVPACLVGDFPDPIGWPTAAARYHQKLPGLIFSRVHGGIGDTASRAVAWVWCR